MKLIHLIATLGLVLNISAKPADPRPEASAGARVAVKETAPFGDDEKVIPWSPARKLLWDDFLCEPKKEGDAVASTSTSLGLSYQVKDNRFTFHVICNFSKEKSWGALKTDYILAHEQGHFDITEIHARKLYAALYNYEYNPVSFKKDVAAIYNRIVKEKEEMQEAYDSETDHSRKKSLQYNWLDKIDTMLTATEIFANYP